MGIRNWSDLATGDFSGIDKNRTIVIMPIGSMEQHGPHLPVATDALCVNATIEKLNNADLQVDALLLPTVWCSKSNEHFNFPGTIYLRRETFTQVLEDISVSVARAGFKKLVIINWHGGNIDLLSCMARDIRQQFNIWTFIIDGGRMLSALKLEWAEPHHYNIHAERLETSIMLASNPHLVKAESEWGKGSDFGHGKMATLFSGYKHLIPEGGKVLMGWVTSDLTDDGVVGDPTGANESEGLQYLDTIVSQISQILPEIASFD
jgi:creatinine amidohydrolase